MMKNGYIIGKRIREVRQMRSMRQTELAELAGITAQYISQIELGQKNISLEAIISVANALNVSLDELLYGVLDNNNSDISKIYDLISDCSYYEMHVIYDTISAVKNSLRNNSGIV